LNAGVGVEAADEVVADVLKLGLDLLRVWVGEQLESVIAVARQTHVDDQLTAVLAQHGVVRQQPRVELVVNDALENGLDARVQRETNVDHAVRRLDNRFTVRRGCQTSLHKGTDTFFGYGSFHCKQQVLSIFKE